MNSPGVRRRRQGRANGKRSGPRFACRSLRSPRFVLLATIVIGAALAAGSVHVPVLLGVAALALASCVALLFRGGRIAARSPAIVLFGLGGYCLFQAVPLPSAWVQVVSPAAADIWAHSLSPFGEAGPAWISVSLDPGASLVEALKWTTYGAVFILASSVARRDGAVPGSLLLMTSAVIVGVVTVCHQMVGATRLYGLYTPTFKPQPWGLGPLLNPNNLAGYLNLGCYAGLGLMVEKKPPLSRWLLGAALAFLLALNVVSASRGGVAALLLGLPVLIVWLSRSEERTARRSGIAVVPAMMAIGAGALLAILGSTRETWEALLGTNTQKISNLALLRPLLSDYRWFGIGRGAFGTVSPAYHVQGNVILQYPENIVVQWLVEWGIPVSVLAAVALWRTLRPGPPRAAAVVVALKVGVFVLLLQNLVDLGLEVPSVAIGACVAVATIYGSRATLRASPAAPGHGVVLATAAAVLLLLVSLFGTHTSQRDRARLSASYRSASGASAADVRRVATFLHAAMRRHPADPFFPLIGALLAVKTAKNPLPWANLALVREPANARAHLVVGHYLARNGAVQQSLAELRLAATYDSGVARLAARIAVAETRDARVLSAAAPSGADGSPMLTAMANLLPASDVAKRLVLLDNAVQRDPGFVPARSAHATALLQALSLRVDPCVGASRQVCVERVNNDTAFVIANDTISKSGVELSARIAVMNGDSGGAVRLLEAECGHDVSCLHSLVSMAFELGSARHLALASSLYTGAACNERSSCAAAHEWVGGLFAARDDWISASAEFALAVRAAPTPSLWFKFGRAVRHAGRPTEASMALERAEKGASRELMSAIAEERRNLPSDLSR